MSFVASEVFATTVGGMGNRLAQMETKLVELFTKEDERLVQQAGQIQAAEVKVATLDGKLTQMPEQLKAIIDEHRVHTAEKNKATESGDNRRCIPLYCCRCKHRPEHPHLELQRGREGTHYLCQEKLDGPSSESFQQQ